MIKITSLFKKIIIIDYFFNKYRYYDNNILNLTSIKVIFNIKKIYKVVSDSVIIV